MASEQSMTLAAIEATKSITMAVREAETPIDYMRLIQTVTRTGSATLK